MSDMKRYVSINDDELSQDLYCDNRISNRKYTLLNFLPKNLWEQFSRFMNQYFLLIACLQLWPLITPVNPASTWGPLIFIFAVSATKEGWDDYNRYLSDEKANEKEVWVVKRGIKKLTSALDGETDLKTRVIPSACMGIDVELLHKVKGVIECPNPDKDIRRFDANLRLFPPFIDNDLCPLTIKNTILQSCYLRNTEWACGVAVYTGNETKLAMSRGVPEPKLTAMDMMIDKLTGAIFIFQIVVVIVLGIAGNVWKDTEARKQWYVQYPSEGPWYELLVIPLRFELLCSIMIPISIKVSLDLVKSMYAKFIDWDNEMFDIETGTRANAANTAISEDLGQVEYILTDKTGTLTENKMVFKRCFIGGIFYGNETEDALKDMELLDAVVSGSPDVIRFLTVMALCNTVIPIRSKSGSIMYKAQSQDEEALVRAAACLHMVFVNKNANILEINYNGAMVQYEVLDTLEFTSDRKRMSVVVKDCKSGKIMLLSKGADEAILPCVNTGQQTRSFSEAVEQYAQLGLRTLCLAWRELENDEYQEWSSIFKEANSSLVDREWRVAEVCQRLEHGFEILGVAAIEDRLQDGVPETITTLRRAGINFWMLTGDKQSTALQIALSCNLVSPEPKGQLLLINGKTDDEVCRSLERVLLTMRITSSEPKDVAFVIDGWALEIALRHYRKAFTELAILSRTAICCRVTPSQKAQLVDIIKSCEYKTLAIGDGGNDVRMIQQADIGVGISGREGLQAARAADYSIGKFRFLKRLILVHGRYSYNRTAFLSQYSFYKSLLICFIQIFFSFISGVSGTSLFNSVSLMAYNTFYTSIPVLVSVLDKDLSERTVMQHPQILFYCQAGRLLNPSTFAGWFGRSLYHAIVVFVITVHAYAYERSEMEEMSMVALSGCIWLQAFVVALETNSFTILQHLAIWGNLAGFYIINWIVSTIPSSGMYTIMFRLCRQPSYWTTMFLVVAAGMGPVLALKYFRYTYRSSKINILQQAERLGGPILSLGNIEPQPRSLEKEATPLLLIQPKNRSPVHEPLLSDSPNTTRRSFGSGTPFDFFQSQSRLSSSYSRNCKDN
ncbi:phospholipid-transporting ATPase 2 isoform X2 [Rhododendron vialii]|uniref:phospholipid-transporting ATPase 2 isoform X2 n=1 Tax=Rhododendron vialii TaxID=182163 RepID=UPI00265FF897|nr:phospholipid-transporting ATPase 2 isoform X2 [Rhododendron vialii]